MGLLNLSFIRTFEKLIQLKKKWVTFAVRRRKLRNLRRKLRNLRRKLRNLRKRRNLLKRNLLKRNLLKRNLLQQLPLQHRITTERPIPNNSILYLLFQTWDYNKNFEAKKKKK